MSRSSTNGGPSEGTGRAEDLTAEDLFHRLSESESESVHDDDVYEALAGESPDAIIASADEDPAEETDRLDDLLTDESALDDLLLSSRTEADGFLWIDTDERDEWTTDQEESGAEDIDEEWTEAFEAGATPDTAEEFGLRRAYSFDDDPSDEGESASESDVAVDSDAEHGRSDDGASPDVDESDRTAPDRVEDDTDGDPADDAPSGLFGRFREFLAGLF